MSRKIIYVITRMVVGGAQETAKVTAEHFHRTGDDVLFVNGPQTGREGQLQLDSDVPHVVMPELVRQISPWRDLRAVWKLYRLFRQHRPDIVHARTSKARIVAPLAARLARVPVIIQTIHGYSFGNQIDRFKWLYVVLEKLFARMYDVNIVVSEADRDEGYALGILKEKDTALIRSGVNVDKIRHDDRDKAAAIRQQYAPRGESIVTLIGRLSMPKTPDVFVEAAALVAQDRRDVSFLVVGDGAKREAIEHLIRARGLADRVFMLGLRTDVAEIMTASDIIVHSSLREGLPKTVLEGMAAGKAVIGTNVGGVPAVIDDGVTGLLVPPSDPAPMAAAMKRFLDDCELRERVIANASKCVYEFSLEKSIADTERLYDALLSDRSRRSYRSDGSDLRHRAPE